jgi:hypothetical protein
MTQPVKIPFDTHLVEINKAGIADLANGTRWRIAQWDLARARKWVIGASVTLAPNDPGKLWAFKMTNNDNDEQVSVGRAVRSGNVPTDKKS